MTKLYLTRHGQTDWNIEGRMQGSMESDLTQLGLEQAKKLGIYLKDVKLDVIYTSPAIRAKKTAELIAKGRSIPMIEERDLSEMNFGIWEGKNFDFIRENYYEQYDCFWNTPHLLTDFPGEDFNSFGERVIRVLNKIIDGNKDKSVLITAHAIVLKYIMGYFEGRPLAKLFGEPIIHPTSLSVIDVFAKGHTILKYAETEHYDIIL